MRTVKLILIGIVIGIANLIPGVSGGTLAAVFGIYDSIIDLIGLNIKKIIAMRKFWIPLAIGTALGILFFSKLISRFTELYPAAALWFFIGIIAGSIPFILSQTKQKIKECIRPQKAEAEKTKAAFFYITVSASFIIAFAIMIAMKYTNKDRFTNEAETVIHLVLWIKLFIYTLIAAAAMIIPGISGSFLMVLFGTYNTVIHAVADLNIAVLIPVALGAAAGLLGGAGVIRFLLKKFQAHTYSAIFGLVIGSLAVLYPGLPEQNGLLLSISMFAAGTAASYISSRT